MTFQLKDQVVVSDYAKNRGKSWAQKELRDVIGIVIDTNDDCDESKILWNNNPDHPYSHCWFSNNFLTLYTQPKPRRRL